MYLDIPTLLVAVSLSMAVCALARLILWRLHPDIPGLASWAAAGCCGTVALTPLGFAGSTPPPLVTAIGQSLAQVGMLCALDGFRRFHGDGGLSRRAALPCAITLALPFAACLDYPRLILLQAANPAIITGLSLLIAAHLWNARSYVTVRTTAWIYLVNTLFFALRTHKLLNGAPILGDAARGELPILLWWLASSLAVTLGMVLMTSERLKRELQDQASRDPLTAALNRRAFSLMAEKELARMRRSGRPLSVLMMDLDHFKLINDRRGHAVGDATLCRFVEVAQAILRAEDIFCRFGGEEFLALLPGTAALQALAVGDRLRVAFACETTAMEADQPGPPLVVTVSIGIHELTVGEDLESAIRQADGALYRAKDGGRNRCELATVRLVSEPLPV